MRNGPYLFMVAPLDYPGKKYRDRYIYEHQYVWWKNTNIIPPLGYQIHHINGDKHDNRFENLEMVFKSTHAKLHGCKKKKEIKLLICDWCTQPFSRESRQYKTKAESGQKRFYCCRSHQVRDQQRRIHGR